MDIQIHCVWGCGGCGATYALDDPRIGNCCGFARMWFDRFQSGIQATDYCEEPPIEDRALAMRWERVVRRLAGKHGH